jgi:hypothetical protein
MRKQFCKSFPIGFSHLYAIVTKNEIFKYLFWLIMFVSSIVENRQTHVHNEVLTVLSLVGRLQFMDKDSEE